ncbi:hypothetical protein [Tichowtungia aerotolerans]|nr:hypothetical protein [Tichowtungia aerotolerans]
MKEKKYTEKITRRRSGERRSFILKTASGSIKSPMSWTAGI